LSKSAQLELCLDNQHRIQDAVDICDPRTPSIIHQHFTGVLEMFSAMTESN